MLLVTSLRIANTLFISLRCVKSLASVSTCCLLLYAWKKQKQKQKNMQCFYRMFEKQMETLHIDLINISIKNHETCVISFLTKLYTQKNIISICKILYLSWSTFSFSPKMFLFIFKFSFWIFHLVKFSTKRNWVQK